MLRLFLLGRQVRLSLLDIDLFSDHGGLSARRGEWPQVLRDSLRPPEVFSRLISARVRVSSSFTDSKSADTSAIFAATCQLISTDMTDRRRVRTDAFPRG